MKDPDRMRLWAGAIVTTLLFVAVMAVLWTMWPDL